MGKIITFLKAENGATAIEYALIASLICLAIVSSVSTLGTNVKGFLYDKVVGEIVKACP